MQLFRLGRQGNFRSMTVLHALARMGIEGLVLVEPDHQFLCLGFFDDADQVVDFDFCAAEKITVMRRELGGGLVLLGPGQLFYQLIIKRGNPRLPLSVADAYRKFSSAIIAAYKRLGVEVFYRPVNDLITTDGRKISGQGAADIESCFVFVGNVLLEFDTRLLSGCMKVPEEKFRARLSEALEQNLSWLARELVALPQPGMVERVVREEFERLLGPLEDRDIPAEAWSLADALAQEFTSDAFIFMETSRKHPTIKLKEGTYLRCGLHEFAGGRILAEVEIDEGRIKDLTLRGDLAFPSEDRLPFLSARLKGVEFDFHRVTQKAAEFFADQWPQCPGDYAKDFALAVVGERS